MGVAWSFAALDLSALWTKLWRARSILKWSCLGKSSVARRVLSSAIFTGSLTPRLRTRVWVSESTNQRYTVIVKTACHSSKVISNCACNERHVCSLCCYQVLYVLCRGCPSLVIGILKVNQSIVTIDALGLLRIGLSKFSRHLSL